MVEARDEDALIVNEGEVNQWIDQVVDRSDAVFETDHLTHVEFLEHVRFVENCNFKHFVFQEREREH